MMNEQILTLLPPLALDLGFQTGHSNLGASTETCFLPKVIAMTALLTFAEQTHKPFLVKCYHFH